jgi:N-acyl homoserine lactone hydrolase
VSAVSERTAHDFERFTQTSSFTLAAKCGPSSSCSADDHREPSLQQSLTRFPTVICILLVSALFVPHARANENESFVRLYTIDCGRIVFKDMGMFSDSGDYDGKPGVMAAPCFLIQHGRETLLWDTGLGDKIASQRDGVDYNGIRLYVDTTLEAQLRVLGLQPADITYVTFSHFHLDHVGNANLFTHSTWIINQAELDAALSPTPPASVDKSLFSAYRTVKTRMIDGDYDVFGDGAVRILKAPGHTPGHQILVLHMSKSGTVILTGDLYHTRGNRRFRRVPSFNTERADTLASMDRLEHIASNTHARVVVQHDPEDFRSLPKFPLYLD